jgi:hypothetical protein
MRFFVIAVKEKSPDFESQLIMDKIKADYSHSAVTVEINPGFEMLYEATDPESRKVPLDSIFPAALIAERIEITHLVNIPKERAVGWLDGKTGIRYAFSQWPGFAMPILKFLGRNGSRELACSELVELFLEYACGIDLHEDNDFVDPKQITEAIKRKVGECKTT